MIADKSKTERLLKIARGQIDGIIKMVEENQYCIDISNQITACQAILSKINKQVLNAHLHSCVISSIEKGEATEKMDEIMRVLDKLL